MNLWFSIAITVLRSALLVAVALPICFWLKSFLRSAPRGRALAWVLLLLPLIAPRLLTGFGYANFSFSLVSYPFWNEWLYAGLLLLTMVPVGTVISYFAPPPPISEQARHCLALAKGWQDRGRSSNFLRQYTVSAQGAVAAGLMFVLAFQEFELASLMGVNSWTVWLFDAQAGGLLLSESLRGAAIPLICELWIIGVVGVVIWRNAGLVAASQDSPVLMSPKAIRRVWTYLHLSACFFCYVPWSFILRASLSGLSQLTNSFAIGSDILAGCLFAFLATVGAYGVAGFFVIPLANGHRMPQRILLLTIGVPGLLGSLVLGLSILFVFQSTPLHVVYGTPIPWLIGLGLFLLPRALLVMLILTVVRSPESDHMTKLLSRSSNAMHRDQARELQWRGSWALHFMMFVLLFFWAYSDLTIASILAPAGIVSAPVRLYNLMHYGQSAVLSAMVVATFGIPILGFGTLAFLRRPIQRVLTP